MVKPLNKEWALFGRKYRVPGAKGDKVDCHACQKQVSAAVNRLQSHLRVCPARPLQSIPTPPGATSTDTLDTPDGALGDPAVAALDVLSPTTPVEVETLSVGSKRPRSATVAASSQVLRGHDDSVAYATRRLEIAEQRLQIERERALREQKRETYELAILAAQARKEQLAAEKQAYETRVVLALSRKQLRDQGVDQHEIDRVLPVEPLGATDAEAEDAEPTDGETDTTGDAEAAATNAAALAASAADANSKLSDSTII